MNSNQNENARTTEGTRRKTNTAANKLNAFFNNKTKMQRQESIEDNCMKKMNTIGNEKQVTAEDTQRKLRNAAKTIMLLGSGNEDSTTEEDNRSWKTAT